MSADMYNKITGYFQIYISILGGFPLSQKPGTSQTV